MKKILFYVQLILLYPNMVIGQTNLVKMSDAEIQIIAEPILADIVKGSNEMNWSLFSKHMPKENATDKARLDVETQVERK